MVTTRDSTAPGPSLAIIGGSGVGALAFDAPPEPWEEETRWGTAAGLRGRLHDREVLFLARHGAGHRVPPHRIPYRANLAALHALGVRAALATFAVGSLRQDLVPGTLVLLDDLIDFALGRTGRTFFDGQEGTPVVHTEITEPFSAPVRKVVREAAAALAIPLVDGGTYLCVEGPRYETRAEVRLFASWGGDVLGMTGVPEATLAREAGLHYAAIAVVTNLGAGLAPTPPAHNEVEAAMVQAMPRLYALLGETVARLAPKTLGPIGPGREL